MRMFALLRCAGVAASVLLLVTFSVGCGHDMTAGAQPSGAACPAQSALTYENFGRSFMEQFCTRCHSSTLIGADRNGAPSDHNFDKLADIQAMIEHIDGVAAAGPMSVNTLMPYSDPRPSESQRRQLGEWLACGAP